LAQAALSSFTSQETCIVLCGNVVVSASSDALKNMAATRAFIVLCVLQSLAPAVAEASVKTNLRPYAARHQAAPGLSHQEAARAAGHPKIVRSDVAKGFRHLGVHLAAAPVAPVAPRAPRAAKALPVVAAPVAAYVLPPVVAEPVAPPPQVALPTGEFPALKQLRDGLVEMRQMHTNVMTVEKTLAADVHLLRESAKLQKMSRSAKARKSALQQVRQTEQLVKVTEAMVVQSRANAVERAQEALSEARQVQKAADALSDEAQAQLRDMEPKSAAAPQSAKLEAPPQPAIVAKPADDDDDADGVANSVADDVAM